MVPHSHELLTRLAHERVRQFHREAETDRLLNLHAPRLRTRLALRLQTWALRLDPEVYDYGKPQRT